MAAGELGIVPGLVQRLFIAGLLAWLVLLALRVRLLGRVSPNG